ncbi:MAG: adenylate/guanylate cyclase domain-containing protein [Proteobacteria bacterium]|nr:adenylate/guanylate cyclase domain-containing protein [Pseudomonadota bacterium]
MSDPGPTTAPAPPARRRNKRSRFRRVLAWWRRGRLPGLAILIGLAAVRLWDPQPVETLRLRAFDLYQVIQPRENPNSQVTIVDIDEESLAEIGQWPWPRNILADMLDRLMIMGAIVVGFDIIFAESDRLSPDKLATTIPGLDESTAATLRALPSNDDLFAQALARSRAVVGISAIGRDLTEEDDKPIRRTSVAFIGGDPKRFLKNLPGILRLIPELEDAAPGRGMVTINPEADGIVRRVPAVLRVGDLVFPSLVVEMLRVATGNPTYAIRSTPDGIESIRIRGFQPIRTDHDGTIWVHFTPYKREGRYLSAKDVINGTVPLERIQNKFILVGTSATGLLDIRTSPIDRLIPGVEVHANMIETILTENVPQLTRIQNADGAEAIFAILAGLLMIVLLPVIGAGWALLLGGALIGGLIGASWYAYIDSLTLIDVTYPAISTFALYSILTYASYSRTASEKRQVRGAFGRYLSPALVEQLADDPSRLVLGGEMRTMTLLFCDIRGFTTISEAFKADPAGLTQLINKFLTPMTDLILERNGTIDKYMGDCIMAFWNAPLDDPEHAKHGCDSALAMFKGLDTLNKQLKADAQAENRPHHPIRVGIGLNTGDCVVGNLGSSQRFDYSVLGDSVNLAARLEGQSKNYGTGIVIGENTRAAAPGFATLELDLITVKGKTEAVRIFALLGGEEIGRDPGFRALTSRNEDMLAAYRSREWKEAAALVSECRTLAKGAVNGLGGPGGLDKLYDLYDERISRYEADPPPADWDGVFTATSK